MLIRYLLYVFLIYLLYRFIVGFVIPVFVTTRQMKKQFHEMHSRMEDYMKQQSGNPGTTKNEQPPPSTEKKDKGDYIDYEEVK